MNQDRTLAQERRQILPIIAALIAAIAPHTPDLPLWIIIWCGLLWGYVLVRLKTGWPMPSRFITYFLTFVSIIGLLATFRIRIGGDAFVGLLALMAAVKPFEMPDHRHRMITILLTYFIIITSLFRSDSLFILIYMVFSVFVTTIALVRINSPGESLRPSAALAFSIIARALPLMAVLFLVFPRLPGSLFGLEDPSAGRSGFSEKLSLNGISSMIQDPTPAFRVEFEKTVPEPSQLYWRGIAFQSFDGRTWKEVPDKNFLPKPDQTDQGIAYTILMPPNFSHRLMALDRPLEGPGWTRISPDHTMKALRKNIQKTAYRAISALPDRTGSWNAPLPDKKPFIFISEDHPNPRTRSLALALTRKTKEPEAKARSFLSYFKANGFSYTLNPPPAAGRDLDSFLFDARTGFCGHYASAFAYMMNVAGVPARVIGGYLGGELNPYGNYLTVRQAYAHAWAEYYDPVRGWVRTDPTLVVRPDRLTVHPDGSQARAADSLSTISFFRKAGFALDALNIRWEAWFTGYSSAEQKAWLNALGLGKGTRQAGGILILLSLFSIIAFAGILIFRIRRRSPAEDQISRAWRLFAKKLSKAGLVPAPGQGPVGFASDCAARRPDLSPAIELIMDLYINLRYKQQAEARPSDLIARIKEFSPGSKNTRRRLDPPAP